MRRHNTHLLTAIFMNLLLFVSPVILQPAIAETESAQAVGRQVEQAVLAEDWAKAAALLVSVNAQTPSPVLRLIKGHATLALNKNNESLCLFLSASRDDLAEWEKWTEKFVERNPQNIIAHYFRGDSLARLERWNDALQAFSTFEHPLIKNAKGVAYAATGQWDPSLVELTEATILDKNLADAYASIGAMWIQKRDGIRGARKAYAKALNLSNDFSLAYNGLACTDYVLCKWKEANTNYRKAIDHFIKGNAALSPLIAHNLAVLTLSLKRAQFPFFSKGDFKDWSCVKQKIQNPHSILHQYFGAKDLPDHITDAVVTEFNKLLEIPNFYNDNKKKIVILLARDNQRPEHIKLVELIQKTKELRKKKFEDMTDKEKDQIRKLNRWVLEYILDECVMHIAMIDSPGFSLQRDINKYGIQAPFKHSLTNEQLRAGSARMNNLYNPLLHALTRVPVVGGLADAQLHSNMNQHNLNTNILEQRGAYGSQSGGVDFNMRKKGIVETGDWGVGTWFGLGYHVEPKKALSGEK